MSTPNEHLKFRKQFDDDEWTQLSSNIEFQEALAADNLDKAGLIADRILIGETNKKSDIKKLKEYQKLRKEIL